MARVRTHEPWLASSNALTNQAMTQLQQSPYIMSIAYNSQVYQGFVDQSTAGNLAFAPYQIIFQHTLLNHFKLYK